MERKTEPVKKKVLGRGLSALLAPSPGARIRRNPPVLQVPLEKVRTGSLQPRKSFPPEALAELVASIRAKGVLQPVLVRPTADGYELVWRGSGGSGPRRARGSPRSGVVRKLTDREALEVALVEKRPAGRSQRHRARRGV